MDPIRIEQPLFFSGEYAIPTSPKDFEVLRCSNKTAYKLNKLFHSSLPIMGNWMTCKPCYVAIYRGIYFASAMWSNPVAGNKLKHGKYILELRRMAISGDAPYNTATRMLSLMRKDIIIEYPHIYKLISYQDTGVHIGTIYKADNWTLASKERAHGTWAHRPGRVDQSKSPKIRWEKQIREPQIDNPSSDS